MTHTAVLHSSSLGLTTGKGCTKGQARQERRRFGCTSWTTSRSQDGAPQGAGGGGSGVPTNKKFGRLAESLTLRVLCDSMQHARRGHERPRLYRIPGHGQIMSHKPRSCSHFGFKPPRQLLPREETATGLFIPSLIEAISVAMQLTLLHALFSLAAAGKFHSLSRATLSVDTSTSVNASGHT